MFAIKLTEKIADPRTTKEQYQSFVRKKNAKPLKQSKMITQQTKSIANLNIIDIISVTTENLKASHELSKIKRQDKKIYQVVGADKNYTSPLYNERTKCEFF